MNMIAYKNNLYKDYTKFALISFPIIETTFFFITL
jgi:hypothetical protein